MSKIISRVNVKNDLGEAFRKVVGDLGGWDNFVKEGERVLLKPNFNTDDDYPGFTDMEFLKEVEAVWRG